MTTDDIATRLVAYAVSAKIAAEIGAPRLATRAVRRAAETAGQLVIALSPAVAATPVRLERERVGSPRTLEDLVAVRWPRARDDGDLDGRFHPGGNGEGGHDHEVDDGHDRAGAS